MTSCNSLYLALLVVNWLKEARRDHFGLIVGSSGYQKPSIFIERVIIFKHFVVFASSASKSPKKVFKRTPKPPKTHRRGPQERPGVSWRRPRRPPNHPQSAPRASLALREASGSHFQALLTSFSMAKESKKSPNTEQTEGPRSQAHASNTQAHARTRQHKQAHASTRKHTQATRKEHASNTQATRKHTQATRKQHASNT